MVCRNDDDAAEVVRRKQLARLLRGARERLQPVDVGLPEVGRRRVKGLRREEVATIAGIGMTWYTRLETAADINVSREALNRIADALRLKEAERTALLQLSQGTANALQRISGVPAAVRRCVDSIRSPAFILSPLWDVVYWNIAFARAWTIEPPGSPPFNAVAYQLTTMREQGLQGDSWEANSRRMIDQYRADYLAHAGDPAFEERLTELRMIDVFRAMFDVGNIESPLVDPARFVLHPTLGRLDYTPVNFSMPDSQLTLTIQSMDTMSERWLHRAIRRTSRRVLKPR
jgi:transcriptional regulator with XRE-family HTH domain